MTLQTDVWMDGRLDGQTDVGYNNILAFFFEKRGDNDQIFKDTLTNNIISFEQLSLCCFIWIFFMGCNSCTLLRN